MRAAAKEPLWRTRAERGSVLGIRLMLWMATALGRGPARLFVRVLALYYTLTHPGARRATRAFLEHIGEAPTFGRIYRQILRFAQVTLDSLFFASGKLSHYEITQTGKEHLDRLKAERRGAILLGAHLGSMHAMRAQSGVERVSLYAVVYTKHAERINAVLREIDPEGHAQLLQMGEGVDFMLRIKELVEGGAFVALLGDRVASEDRSVEVEFFGERARFPAGPYILASILQCPVYLTFGLYRDPRTYDLFCEPFAEKVELPRAKRQEALEAYVARYAERLEHYVSKAPDNWFNFFDFWERA